MALKGKKIVEIEIKSCGDAYHDLFARNPHKSPDHSPELFQRCDLLEGEWGADGSVICWRYFLDGKNRVSKQIVHVNEEEKWITFDVIDGDLMEEYKSFLFTAKVDKKEGDNNLVTWILEYEKLHENVPDPDSTVEFITKFTKDVEESHLKV